MACVFVKRIVSQKQEKMKKKRELHSVIKRHSLHSEYDNISELLLVKNSSDNSSVEAYNVFYIPKGKENLAKTIIMSTFGVKTQAVEEFEKVRCIIIFDSEDQRIGFSLPPNYEVAFYATINNANGETKFFK